MGETKYEKGTAEPKIENLLKIAKFFNIEILDLLEKDLLNNAVIQEELEKVSNSKSELALGAGEARDHLIEELLDSKEKIERFIRQSDDMQKILEGFREFHRFKMESNPGFSDDVKKILVIKSIDKTKKPPAKADIGKSNLLS